MAVFVLCSRVRRLPTPAPHGRQLVLEEQMVCLRARASKKNVCRFVPWQNGCSRSKETQTSPWLQDLVQIAGQSPFVPISGSPLGHSEWMHYVSGASSVHGANHAFWKTNVGRHDYLITPITAEIPCFEKKNEHPAKHFIHLPRRRSPTGR